MLFGSISESFSAPVDDRLVEATKWCEDRGLHFTSIKDNTPSNTEQYGTNPRKVYADIYIDDRSPWMMYKPRPDDFDEMRKHVTYIIGKLGGKLV